MSELIVPELVTVSPEMASEWLKKNTHNRLIRQKLVDTYARDMAAGRWKVNGESIKLAVDDTVLDGQHRLLAIVKSGVSVEVWVFRGLPADTQATMDSGSRRTTADALDLEGYENASALASIAKRAILWERGEYTFKAAVTTSEVQEFIVGHPELLRSTEIAVRVRSSFRPLQQSVTGVAHWVLTQVSMEDAPWFFARLGDGAEMSAGHPILVLRQRIVDESLDRSRKASDAQRVAYVIRAWNAVREDRPLTKIIQPPSAPMPMPK